MRWKWLTFWGMAGIAMLLASFWDPWFDVDFTWFKVNVGWFAVTYSGLLVIRNLQLRSHLMMTPRELYDYGERLSGVTPEILDMAEEGLRPREIAEKLEGRYGLPPLISLKYMIALSKHSHNGSKVDFPSEGSKEVEEQHPDGPTQ